MQNLNDYYYFVQVVKFQGFTKASEALGITKSKLSRRISELESRLDVRLIQRNTRKFTVTDIGQQFYAHCLKILDEVVQTENFIQSSVNDELCGTVKISCPVALAEMPIGKMVAEFMLQYPDVNVNLLATNERMDVIEQGIDLALRVRSIPMNDSDLIVRDLDAWEHVLVASPKLIQSVKIPSTLEDLALFPSVGFYKPKHYWDLYNVEKKETQQVAYTPRLKSDSFAVIKSSVLKGVGIASLPKVFVLNELKSGQVVEVLPDWRLPQGVIHVAYASRQGMLPAVRALLEYFVEQFKLLDVDQKRIHPE